MIIYKCDQCEEMVENPEERGSIIKKHYCPTCAEKIDAFYTARDDLHNKIVSRWNEGLEDIKNGLNLPD